ncbi:glycosyl hydrolase [Flammeovirgaceae bacterium SG7u.111]|nr:glycosyl hydrolase [Flammeovirgaceae bacterium SG7u.132]WPO35882.1 glycosyl hydrolase [Flammeovirgaceae bacterium SG7u.111]
MKKTTSTLSLLLILAVWTTSLFAQSTPPATSAKDRLAGFSKRKSLIENSLVAQVPFKNIGPTVMSGRVVDIDINEKDPTHFYVAYASGGLWKTENNGASFTPLFDNEAVMSIGDIAVDWETETIWVGTGENNSSRSSYSGTGIYKSTDSGKNWEHLGLEESHHIGRIILHPENKEIAWVASLGHLYSTDEERGLYKTTDGGKTWKKTISINEMTGIVDLVIDPENPDVLYAAAWERMRTAWNFVGSGEGSGIYKSTDGGETWDKLNTKKSGFPATKGVGRIGLAVAPSNPQIVYAMLDNQDLRDKKKEDEKYEVTKEKLKSMDAKVFANLKEEDINEFLDRQNFPQSYNATDIKAEVAKGDLKPIDLVNYLEDANAMLFDTPIKGAEVYRSDDGGKTWKKTHEDYIESLVYTYGYYFGQIRVSPTNPDKIYTVGVPIIKSEDAGKTWKSINGDNVHADHHALWVSDSREGHLVLGNDGGINISYDDGETWFKCNSVALGQFYSVNVDMAKPYKVYGGLQDNGVWMGKHTYQYSDSWHQSGKYPYQSIMGGDGMQVEIDTRDNATVYTGFQFGNYYRINTTTGERKKITPKHELGERPLRFNWQTPIYLSRHNQDVLYMGSNKFHRSLNKGEEFKTLSGDLTTGGKKGNVPYGTLATIHESPLKFGLIYVGSDDGLIHVSKDGGYNWEKVSDGLGGKELWVSRVQASAHKEPRVYASLNGYRSDNFEALVYASEDYGKTWKKIGLDLPAEPVNVIKEDPENEDILYVGTDHGLYISLDRGKSFMAFYQNLPAVAIHDLVVHPRDKDLVVGTHGRSIYVANVEHVQQLTPELLTKGLHAFEVSSLRFSTRWGKKSWSGWNGFFEPEVELPFYAKNAGTVTLEVSTKEGVALQKMNVEAEKGLNYLTYDLSFDEKNLSSYQSLLDEGSKEKVELGKGDNGKYYLQPGSFNLKLIQDENESTVKLEIKKPRGKMPRKPQKKTP